MSKKLYVGGLSWGTNEDTLYASFQEFGQVEEVKVITDRETGRSRGFGFVTFANDDDAMKAIDGLNNTQLDGRQITVNEARERPPVPVAAAAAVVAIVVAAVAATAVVAAAVDTVVAVVIATVGNPSFLFSSPPSSLLS